MAESEDKVVDWEENGREGSGCMRESNSLEKLISEGRQVIKGYRGTKEEYENKFTLYY